MSRWIRACLVAAVLVCAGVAARGDLPGDLDGDCDVDLEDLGLFVGAMSGPGVATSNPDADLDGDNDCDLQDVGIFAANFTGPGSGCPLEFVATEDDGFSRVSGETLINRGKAGSIRCKTRQEMVIMKFDLSAIRGWTVTEAELHVCASSSSLLYAADLATINVPWSEGNRPGAWGDAEVGEPCWDWRQRPADLNNPAAEDWWTYPGSNFTSASYGNNGSLVSFAHPADGGFSTYTDGNGRTWYRIRVSPDVVHALILDQYGLTLSDTRGYRMQNNTVYTRDQWGNPGPVAPRLYVIGGPTDTTPPGPISNFAAAAGPWNGQVLLSWTAPSDSGPTGRAFGYDVRYSSSPIDESNFLAATAVQRWRIPRPVDAGQNQQMLVEGLTPGASYYFAVRAYDQAGNNTAIATTSLTLPPERSVVPLLDAGFAEPPPAGAIRSVAGVLRYWAAPDLSKVNPVTSNRMEDGYGGSGADGYKKSNPVWDAANNKVILRAAGNEVVAFQLILERLVSNLTNVSVAVSDLTGPGGATIASVPNIELFRCWYVPDSGTYYPDACIPLFDPFPTTFSVPEPTNAISGQINQAVWVDIYVPKTSPPGLYSGTITVSADQLGSPLTIGLELLVRYWQLPDEVSFIVDLNGYHEPWDWVGTSDWQRYLDCSLRYFQLGHKHRANVNTVPYSHTLNSDKSPRVDSTRVPGLTGSGANIHVDPNGWTTFDEQFGRYLDGSAFTPAMGYNGPGMGVPIPAFYLPVFESWPLSSYFYYDAEGLGGAYWYNLWPGPDKPPPEFLETAPAPHVAYPDEYAIGVKNVVRDIAEHAQASGWHGTYLQFYLNNKYKWGSASNPHSQFWNLDEPSDGDDFLAIGYFNQLYVDGVASANAPDVKFHFRVDISTRVGFSRGQLDDRINLWDCSAVNDYHGMIQARKYRFPGDTWWYYGGGSPPSGTGTANSKRFLQVWAWGIDGALPYWNNYSTNWNAAETLSIVYSGQNVPGYGTYDGAIASVRLKQMRRGQQDIEYLMYLARNVAGWDRDAVTRALQQRYADAGGQSYSGMSVLDFYRLREDVATTIVGPDSDGDNVPDRFDDDDDNDGVPDADDAFPTDPSEWSDLDGDGVGDNADLDDDNDGVADADDAFPRDPAEWSDLDGDGIGDNADDDDDGDGVVDAADAFPVDPSEWSDADGDGIGDNADLDDDDDGYPDVLDAFARDPSEWLDTDGDGVGNNADDDDDNDGFLDVDDPAPLNPFIPAAAAAREMPSPGEVACGACGGASSATLMATVVGLSLLRRRRWW